MSDVTGALLKGADAALSAVLAEDSSRSNNHTRKDPSMTKEAKIPMTAESAMRLLKSAADEADLRGDTIEAASLRQEVAVMKMTAAERGRQANPGPGHYGPGATALFDRTGRLGDDSQVGGL